METWRIVVMFATRLALSSAILFAIYKYLGMIPFILGIPLAGVLLAKPVLEAAGSWFDWARKQPYAAWHGNYYEFANIQIRILEVGKDLWIVDTDLLRVVGEEPTLMLGSLYGVHDYDVIPETGFHGFSPDGAKKVLSKSNHFESKRMLMWLQREVYKPHRRKQEIAADNAAARPSAR